VRVRVRLRFSKLGKVRFTSQRDVARMWERALRRDRFPMAYTAGFSPRPQLSFGLALPTGCESLAEYLDVTVDEGRPETESLDVAGSPARLTPLLPDGIDVTSVGVLEAGSDSLQELVTSCRWVIALSGASHEEVTERVAAALSAESLPVVRRRKGRVVTDDLRPSIIALEVMPRETDDKREDSTVDVVAELATRPRGVRPPELMAVLSASGGVAERSAPSGGEDHGPRLRRACRTNQWIECGGSREEPLSETGGPSWWPVRPTPASERAS
jgi:radical SAM-linked protein